MYNFFSQNEEIVAVMSTQEDGNMRLTGDMETSLRNRQKFCEKNHIHTDHLVSANIAHGTNIEIVESAEQKILDKTDALVTRAKNVYLSLTTADCFPVLLYDQKQRIVGIAHAGWRGIVSEIVPRTINVMTHEGAHPRELRVAIGPGISQRHFEFTFGDVINNFGFYNQDKYIAEGSTIDKVRVDLRQMILDQLRHYGVDSENIHDCAECTFANQHKFFSARRDKDGYCVMMSVIGIRE
jgi:polyphenol oxidase